jgi:hypothetical protein
MVFISVSETSVSMLSVSLHIFDLEEAPSLSMAQIQQEAVRRDFSVRGVRATFDFC